MLNLCQTSLSDTKTCTVINNNNNDNNDSDYDNDNNSTYNKVLYKTSPQL